MVSSTKRLSQIRDEWGISSKVHRSVIERLEQEFSQNITGIYDDLESIPPDREPQSDVGTYMKALRDIDGRRWHDREVDFLTERFENILFTSDYDLLLRDVDMLYSDQNYDWENGEMRDKREKLTGVGLPYTDLDFAMVSVDGEQVKMDYWDVKTKSEDLQASELPSKVEDAVTNFNESSSVFISANDNSLCSKGVGERKESELSPLPNRYRGDYILSNEISYGEIETLNEFLSGFMGYDNFIEAAVPINKELESERFI